MVNLTQQKPPLLARQYRQLWLEDANRLGLVAEILADVLCWQPSDEQPLPDPLELAQAAAMRLHQLERAVAVYRPRLKGRKAPIGRPEYA